MNQPYRTIIIDDELLARERLLKLTANFPQCFNVIASAKNGTDAKEKINSLKPELIFLDIEMPGLTGFELLEQLDSMPMVIFCTAFDQYALQAFETHSIDYLVKPVRLERLEKTVNKLIKLNGNHNSQKLLEAIKEMSAEKEAKKMTSITVRKGEKLFFIKLEDVLYFEADAKYSCIYTNTEKYLTELSLTQLETKLPDFFLRVQRGIIINMDYVENVQKYFNSRYVITLKNKQKTSITTGRSYKDAIKSWMGV
ncbi:LytTR family transcriptional regulator DNA-binding domain-containing protein [Cellulophaga sp. F20128]|uniref:LytR/AlgR family response regulator transcription factor n=1 Tax=Cellulophaga sp. F20128 TaxID=2926413 RepID=UPI001FF3FE35|nr:LytTR family transcriptional regulator DNA-binding domain-containing protein [Cellulophaga sp. F20128]MCK0158948.1 LytTR family transcriptional regulator DNA-binding domain-containing protein [Cellulophaga sp. F20128]